MSSAPVVLDSDILSELSRGNRHVSTRAARYLEAHGALTITAVSVYERLRGYRDALRRGQPYQSQLQRFQAFVATCRVLPFDDAAAAHAAIIWAALTPRHRRALGDILIAAIASVHGLPLVTRNRRDFEPMTHIDEIEFELADWTP